MYPLSRILARARTQFADCPAVVDGDLRMTYEELGARVDRLAGALLGGGLAPGDRVAILDHNSHRYLEAYYACAQAGLIYMPLNSRLAEQELRYILKDSDARALLYSEPFAETVEEIRGASPNLEVVIGMALDRLPADTRDYEAMLEAAAPRPEAMPAELDDIALIYYTSGTTGDPKGVCITHGNMFAGAIDPLTLLGITRDDVWLHVAPLFHLAGAWAVWSMPLVGAVQITQHFEPRATVALMERERVTMTSLPGAIIGMVANLPEARAADLGALRVLVYGGSPTPAGVLRKAAEVFPGALTHVYGITETSAYVTTLLPGDHVFEGPEAAVRRTSSAGQAGPLIDVAIVDDDGRHLAPGEIGEIVCAGPKIMKGYWRKPEATAAALRDGWYHTGDMGYLDERDYLFVVDRKKDMIITGGENVYSVEVESVLSMHPAVLEVAVIGVPDETWGEAVAAIVVPREGMEVSADDLKAFCRGRIGGYKIPKSIEFRGEPLPKTGPGKIAKRRLREPYWRDRDRSI